MGTIEAVALGIPMTLVVTTSALLVGTMLAVPLMLGIRSRSWLLRAPSRAAVDLIRGIPPIVWLFILFYGISIGSTRLSALAAGVGALGIVASAYIAEIFRGSLKALQHGQWEAASALGLSGRTTWLAIIAPQALRTALPGYTNYAIALLKDSSIVSVVGVTEVVNRTGQLSRTSDMGIFVFVVAAGLYIAMSVPLGMLSRSVDKRMRQVATR